MSSARVRLGFLYPGYAAEDDYVTMAERLQPQVDLRLAHTSVGVDQHSIEALLDLGGAERLAEGARELRGWDPDVVVWACTSGSFVFGWDGALAQISALEEVAGCPASSTSFAFVEAARSIGADAVTVAASYPSAVAERFVDFLAAAGIRVRHLGSADIVTAEEVGRLNADDVRALVADNVVPGADAVLVPDTAMHTALQLPDLEEAAGCPVLTANQVSLWHALRIAGWRGGAEDLGELFERPRR